uniref:Cation/H+ exchanger domain-containing protein n=1 Tax=Acrobeloides nanus TaxID=290746 RepID=A0A914CZC9_9BILA
MTTNWEEVKVPLTISIWIFIACLGKIAFNYYKPVAEMFPDSALLILVGLVIGIFLNAVNADRSYNMPARQFFDNVGACVAFALFNTGFNIAAIGISLWAISLTGIFSVEVKFLDLMLFGSIIADVDPVAVIVIFEDMHVHDLLYISVFGESVLNDGISVVIYNMLQVFVEIGGSNIIARDYIFGLISFFTIALGGIAVGLLLAYLCAFLTKYTKNVPILNPVMVFLLPFCAYWVAELLGFSSILAIVFCGVTLRPYIRDNVTKDAFKAIHHFTK